MIAPMQDEVDALKAEVERLRDQGLRQAEGWEQEKQESQRLHAAEVRYKNLTRDLQQRLEETEANRDTERERAQLAEEAVVILKARVDELIESFTRFGDHSKECQKRSLANKFRKKDVPCDCGFERLLAGGGVTTSETEG